MANTTLSATDKSATVTRATSLQATGTSTSNGGIRVVDGKRSGKFYFEAIFTVRTGGNSGFGIARGDANLASFGSSTLLAAEVYPSSGNIWLNGSSTGKSLGALLTSDTVGFAVDLDNWTLGVRKGAAGNWNGTPGADPANPATMLSIAAIKGDPFDILIAASFNANLDSCTFNVGDTVFVGA